MTSTTSEGVDDEAEETASLTTEARRHHQIQGRRPGIQSSAAETPEAADLRTAASPRAAPREVAAMPWWSAITTPTHRSA